MLSVNDQGIIENIPYFPSPNFNERPSNSSIDLLILHNITVPPGLLKPENVRDLFLNQLNEADDLHFVQLACLRVSAHLLITREGTLWQFVPLHLRAWHAGDSCYQKRKNCNDYSIAR